MTKRILYDYHIHTDFSLDSDSKLLDVLNFAVLSGLKEISITNHIEPNPYDGIIADRNFEKHLNEIDSLQNQFKDKITVLKGAEITLFANNEKNHNDFINKYKDLDFVIGSSHSLNRKDLYSNFDFTQYEKNECYEIYLKEVLNCIPKNKFNVYGHLDFISRYSKYDDPIMYYKDFSDLIDEILKTLINNNKGLEINTSGIRYGINSFYPSKEILTRYKELGGEIVTVGSDSHTIHTLGKHFDMAYEYLKECGFDSVTTFRKMKPIQNKI